MDLNVAPPGRPVSRLARDYEHLARTFSAQPPDSRRFLERQAGEVAAALDRMGGAISFLLPEEVVLEGGEMVAIPALARRQAIGGVLRRLSPADKRMLLFRHLNRLEGSLNPALAVCGGLLRYTLARRLVYDLLPDGQPVCYLAADGDEIPSIPVEEVPASTPALAAVSEAVAPGGPADAWTEDRSPVQRPSAARRFYLPQWVAFDEDSRLLATSVEEAEACITHLRRSVLTLRDAAAVCPSIVADETYQAKRAGMLGQLVNQGRALARFHTVGIIAAIRCRAGAGSLNRGLRLALPYFDGDELALKEREIRVIPGGWITFSPALVVRAMQLERAKVRCDRHLNRSTRRHLLSLLDTIEQAFSAPSPDDPS